MPSTSTQALQSLMDHWRTQWGATTPFVFGNESFDPEPAEWAKVYIREGDPGQPTLGAPGNRMYERRGTILVQVGTLEDIGAGRAVQLAALARDVFDGKTISPGAIRCTRGKFYEVGNDGSRYLANAEITFAFEELK